MGARRSAFRLVSAPLYVRARAPLRLSFCGGGTDVSPYPEERGGMVLSATINQYAYASLRPRRDSKLTLASLDYDMVARYDHPGRVRFDGKLDLIKAVVKAMKVKRGADLWVHSDAPPGSGLGSSSTLVVAMIGVLREWLGRSMESYEVAELAYRIEREDMKLAGGRQDQYAASFGGFNFIEFGSDQTVVTPLRIRRDVLQEMEYRLLLCYMGQTRQSAKIIDRQTASYRSGKRSVVQALDRLKKETLEMTRKGDEIIYDITVEDPDSFVEPWVMPTRILRPFGGDPVIAERADCQIYEAEAITNQLRH